MRVGAASGPTCTTWLRTSMPYRRSGSTSPDSPDSTFWNASSLLRLLNDAKWWADAFHWS
jgi:hypothetical protein